MGEGEYWFQVSGGMVWICHKKAQKPQNWELMEIMILFFWNRE